jgi:hypothetical protein
MAEPTYSRNRPAEEQWATMRAQEERLGPMAGATGLRQRIQIGVTMVQRWGDSDKQGCGVNAS